MIQVYYYRWENSRRRITAGLGPGAFVPSRDPSEETPLIPEERRADTREKSTPSTLQQILRYGSALCFILGTGIAAWAIDENVHKGQPRTAPEEVLEWKSQLLGWISAILYSECDYDHSCVSDSVAFHESHLLPVVGARIPQIRESSYQRRSPV